MGSSLRNKLSPAALKVIEREKKKHEPLTEPLWKGPEEDGATQSLLGVYLCDKERFRLAVMEGLQPEGGFSEAMEYGSIWHEGEEALLAGRDWKKAMTRYASELRKKYSEAKELIDKWLRVAETQFPVYVRYWDEHEDVTGLTSIYQEKVFKVRYELPSGRIVTMKGKWDGVNLIVPKTRPGIYVQEDKTRADVNENRIKTELPRNLQVVWYFIALAIARQTKQYDRFPELEPFEKEKLNGVIFNVVRRPLADWRGKFNIAQRQGRLDKKTGKRVGAESLDDYYKRLGELIEENGDWFFYRWKMDLSQQDILRFKSQSLDPILENLWDDYEWYEHCFDTVVVSPFDYKERAKAFPNHRQRHFLLPFGVYNPMIMDRPESYARYLENGDEKGLYRVHKLFPEL